VKAEAARRSSFNLLFGVLVTIVVAVGFLPTLDAKLIHPSSRRPLILYVHAAVFAAWVVLFVVQAALVRTRRTTLHRRLGPFAAAAGALIPGLGLATALTITRLQVAAGDLTAEQSLIIPIFDMTAFTTTFCLALYWRHRPDYHSRFMVLASAGLTVAAFARFPSEIVPNDAFYIAVDVLIAIAMLRDWMVMRRLHPVYGYGLAALIAGQTFTMWIALTGPALWLQLARVLSR
jgi:hypothetical protein